MGRIKQLDSLTTNMIAAGEVVERPTERGVREALLLGSYWFCTSGVHEVHLLSASKTGVQCF